MKRSFIKIVFIVMLCWSFQSCIDDFDLGIDQESFMVVDGQITDANEPQVVSMYRYDGDGNRINIEGAQVIVMDDNGGAVQLYETAPGKYEAVMAIAEVGKCYTLDITTATGRRYESTPEEVLPNVGFSALRWEQDIVKFVSDFGNTIEKDVVKVYVDSDILGDNNKQYRWRAKNIYELTTTPELNVEQDLQNPDVYVPAPLACSGYFLDLENPGSIDQIYECECCECYVTEYNSKTTVSNTKVSQGIFNNVHVVTYDIDERFRTRFYIEVDQLSLSDNAYEFWSLVASQAENSSSIFASPPAQIQGNITSLDNPDEVVLGYFGASAIETVSVFIGRGEIQAVVPKDPVSTKDCRRIRENSTTDKPNFW